MAALLRGGEGSGSLAPLATPPVPNDGRRHAEHVVKKIVTLIFTTLQSYAIHLSGDRAALRPGGHLLARFIDRFRQTE